MSKKHLRESEEKIRVDSEIKKRRNRYYEMVSDRYRTFGVLMILFLAIFGGVLLLKFGDYITYDNFVYLMRDFNSVTGSEAEFSEVSYPAQNSSVFTPFRDGFAVVGSNRVTVFDRSGVELLSDDVSLSYPAASASEKYLLVYDIGGTTYSLYNSITRVIKCTTETPIVSASVSDDGSYVVTTEGKEAKYLVRLYNSAFKLKMTVRKDKYVIDSAISRNGKYFAVASLFEEGARFMGEVSFYKSGEDKELVSFTYNSSMPIAVSAQDGGFFTVLSDDALRVYSSKGEVKNELVLSGEKVAHFDTGATGSVLVCETNSIGNSNRVYTFDNEGNITYDGTVRERVYGVCMSVSDDDIAAYLITTDELAVLGTDSTVEKYPISQKALALADTSAGPLYFTPDRAYRFTYKSVSSDEAYDTDEVTDGISDSTEGDVTSSTDGTEGVNNTGLLE